MLTGICEWLCHHYLFYKDLSVITQTYKPFCNFITGYHLYGFTFSFIVDSHNLADPSLYLPDLVRNVYSPDENQSSASDAIIGVLKRHNQNIDDIIFLLLDCLKYVFFS
jgi:hypothetical protein